MGDGSGDGSSGDDKTRLGWWTWGITGNVEKKVSVKVHVSLFLVKLAAADVEETKDGSGSER
jgi:hypothetical protein